MVTVLGTRYYPTLLLNTIPFLLELHNIDRILQDIDQLCGMKNLIRCLAPKGFFHHRIEESNGPTGTV